MGTYCITTLALRDSLDAKNNSYRFLPAVITIKAVLGGISPKFSATMINSCILFVTELLIEKEIGVSDNLPFLIIKTLL